LFDDATGRIIVAFPNGKRFAARLLDRDQNHDLAALSIRRPDIEPIAVSETAPTGMLTAGGFGPNGQFRCVRGNVTGRAIAVGATYPSLTLRGAVRPGDSGGGVLDTAGQLVGIVWGQRDGLTYATCGQPVRDFLNRVMGRVRGSAISHTPAAVAPLTSPQPLAPSPQPPTSSFPSPAPCPQIDWPTWSTEMERRIQSLHDTKQDKGDYLQPGDLNGYLRASDVPKFDESQFARRDELESRLQNLVARWTGMHTRFESIEERIKSVATAQGGLFQGLSLGKLLAATLGLSGPLAAAVVVASGLVGRRLRNRKTSGTCSESSQPRSSPLAPRPSPIAVDTPPPPQRMVPENHYVPYEKDSFAKAHQWASEQVARKYPGATEVLQAQDSLIKQHIAANR
jgi:hypothetical protein